MRKLVFIAVLCAFVAAPVMADPFGHGAGYDGGTAYYTKDTNYGLGNGGEFTIEGGGLLLSNSAYVYGTTSGIGSDSGSFQSFCLEIEEYIREPMRIWVSEQNKDLSGPGSHAWYGGVSGTGDDLDPMTAYLYTQFATSALASSTYATYNYNPGPGGNRPSDAEQLQRAIWYIEGEIDSLVSGSNAEAWYNEAAAAGWTDIGNVRVLQMYKYNQNDDEYYRKQDQLYLTPIPGAAILGILGLCVAGVKLRKFA